MDLENTMQFIVNQQAQFVANIHLLQESQRDLGVKVDKLSERVDKLHEIVKHHDDAHIVANAIVSKLADHLEDFVERQGWFFDGHKQLLEAQVRTETNVEKLADKIDHFIDEVRKNISGGNGKKNGGKGKK
ncbi:MAG TPA: hypothetical protein VGV68_09660 [Terriglobia bacterium]|nr:hypothetical protein [Terriglobia bacterium]